MAADPTALVALASSGILGLGVTSAAALKGWHGWLDLKRLEMSGSRPGSSLSSTEVFALKERVRRLEAIANGTDL